MHLANDSQQHIPCVLVMEDDPALNRLFTRTLISAGYTAVPALTLEQGHTLLSSPTRFDVFLCDMHMGDASSLGLLRDLRHMLTEKGTQVVIATGEAQYESVGRELNVDFFLEKPVSPQMLVTLVNRLTNQSAVSRMRGRVV